MSKKPKDGSVVELTKKQIPGETEYTIKIDGRKVQYLEVAFVLSKRGPVALTMIGQLHGNEQTRPICYYVTVADPSGKQEFVSKDKHHNLAEAMQSYLNTVQEQETDEEEPADK